MILFATVMVFYLVAALGHLLSLAVKRITLARASSWVLLAAAAFHGLFIAVRWIEFGAPPVVSVYDSLGFLSWAVTAIYLFAQWRTQTTVLGAVAAPAAFGMIMISSWPTTVDVGVLSFALKSGWAVAHIVCTLAGEAFLCMACCAAIVYLIQDRLLKRKRLNALSRYLPSLGDLDRVLHVCIVSGFTLFTLGIFLGLLRARAVWGAAWHWDPKFIIVFVSWFFFALLLHQRLALGWKGKKSAVLTVVAFVVLIFAFFGDGILFGTIHRFS
ncbi:MAG: cytochrome c biogenesis protein CcsA [Deltaproteobacteria bacterium]|nr:cytochrome c biogenesis protein CcsA [Deltaproteobacteria bacterium]